MDLLPHKHLPHDVLRTVIERSQPLRLADWAVILFMIWIGILRLGDGKLWGKPDPNAYMWYVAPQKSGQLKVRPKKCREIGIRLDETKSEVAILWGSQSGVSESFAKRLAGEWHARFALLTMVGDLDDFDAESLAEVPSGKLVVFLVSTFGEGDPPDNAIDFFSSLEKMRKKGTDLRSLHYLAMGMGNKNYKHYNEAINILDGTLTALGAKRVGPVGRADESLGTTEEDFMDWKAEVLEDMGDLITLEERPMVYEPAIDMLDVCVDEHMIYMGERSEHALYNNVQRPVYNAKNPYPAPIALSKTLSSIEDRRCVHMEFDLSAVPAMRYQTGDHLALWPANPTNEVQRLLRLLGVDELRSRTPIMIDAKEGTRSRLPSPTTREALFTYYLEIAALTSRDFLVMLSQYAPTEAAGKALQYLGKDREAFRTEIASRCLNIGKVMELVAPNEIWSDVPFSLLVESFNHVQPRSYSISSSPLVQPRQPTITMVVNNRKLPPQLKQISGEETTTDGQELFQGIATNFLLAHDRNLNAGSEVITEMKSSPNPSMARACSVYSNNYCGPAYNLEGPRFKLSGSKIYVHIKRSDFKLPLNPLVPLIMVGAGTGIAPLRGFIQERARLVELGKPVGKMLLFFGCRDNGTDFLYRDEWETWKGILGDRFEMVMAFSRLPGQKKTYVQDALLERREEIASLVEDGAALYICGAASMAREVRKRLVEIMAESRSESVEEVDSFVSGKMKKAGLYHEDVWG